jgi:FkbM family methyltransferase
VLENLDQFQLAKVVGHCQWLRRGVRTRLLRALLPRHVVPREHFEINLHGYRYTGSLENWIDWNLFFLGGYEEEIQQLIRVLSATGRAGVFLDVGANCGAHTLFASRLFHRVHAFEPFPPVRDRLFATVARNHIDNIEVHAVGLGAADGIAPFFAPPEENLGTGSFVGDYSSQNIRYRDLEIREGDPYLLEHVGRVDVVKVDVEGFEIEVLRGMRQTLESCRPDLVLELSDATWRQIGSTEGLAKMLPHDYEIFNIHSRKIHFWLLERSGLRIEPVSQNRPTANVLAIAAERANSVKLHCDAI